MQVWMRRVAVSVFAAVLALGSVGCDDDSGLGGLFALFFNLAGAGQYQSLNIQVDLDDLPANVDIGSCELDPALDPPCQLTCVGQGCPSPTTTLQEETFVANGIAGNIITLIIDGPGCVIPADSTLIECQVSGDANDILGGSQVSGVCTPTSNPPCDTMPIICSSTEAGDTSCATTSTTSPTSTSTSTTVPSTMTTTTSSITLSSTTQTTIPPTSTTTTMGPVGDVACVVTFSTPTNATFGALQYDTDYSASSGGFVGSAAMVECTGLTGGSEIVTFNDIEGTSTLATGVVALFGYDGPGPIAECNWLGSTVPVAGDFAITIVDASDSELPPAPIPGAQVEISSIVCQGSSTSSTLPPTSTTTTTMGGGPTTTVTTTTTTMPTTTTTSGGGLTSYVITFGTPETLPDVGALQYAVDYSGAPGEFEGSADMVACVSLLSPQVIATFNDLEGTSTLNVGFVALFGFSTPPPDLAQCQFNATQVPLPGDFAITVVDASTTAPTPIVPLPAVNVINIAPGTVP